MIKDNLASVKERIASACSRRMIDPGKVFLVCVTKGRTLELINEAFASGLKCFGENRVQEAKEKYPQVPGADWHMIGHLQLNKVKDAVKMFSLIHSVDSVELAREIDKQALRIGKVQDILVEVKTSFEESKFGFKPESLPEAVACLAGFKNLKVKGLMTIAPMADEAEGARKYFSRLRQLRDSIDPSWLLSMGMSDDFEVAVEEGADMVRLGRAIFG